MIKSSCTVEVTYAHFRAANTWYEHCNNKIYNSKLIKYFDHLLITLIHFQAKKPNIYWFQFQKCNDLMLLGKQNKQFWKL